MKIRVQPYDIEGWIPAHALATADQLKGEFPELYFVDGRSCHHGIARDPARAPRSGVLRQVSQRQRTKRRIRATRLGRGYAREFLVARLHGPMVGRHTQDGAVTTSARSN